MTEVKEDHRTVVLSDHTIDICFGANRRDTSPGGLP